MVRKWITFDKYSDKIREAHGLALKTAPLAGRWDFARLVLHRTILQFSSEGSGTIIHGMTRSDGYFLFMQSTTVADRIVFDGMGIKWPEIVLIPPASRFTFTSSGTTRWISLFVPTELVNVITNRGLKYLGAAENSKTLIKAPAAKLEQFIDAATMARERLQFARPKRKINFQAIEDSLLGILASILLDSVGERRGFNKRTERLISKVLECLRRDNQIHVLALARAAGISERTLHRVFKKYFRMGPKRYLKFRQLNLVRRALRHSHSSPVSVTAILAENGVTEFGRFAIEYKALFGESPAETLQNYLVPRSKRRAHR